MISQRLIGLAAGLAITLLSTGIAAQTAPAPSPRSAEPLQLDVYKSPTCGCCQAWIDHAQSHGLKAKVHHPDDLNAIKKRFSIDPRHQSCHTAVTADGYVFEGHIPAPVIARFLAEKPAGALGLAVPGMPVGSPGMEMGDQFTPYDVLLLKRDGGSEVYTRVTSAKQTF